MHPTGSTFATMSADRVPVRGATVNGGGLLPSGAAWADVSGQGANGGGSGGLLKPHAQAKLLSPTEKCKVGQ